MPSDSFTHTCAPPQQTTERDQGNQPGECELVGTLIDCAHAYRDRGLAVFPVGRHKRPLVYWKPYQENLPDHEQIDAWWAQFPSANIGAATGAVSKLVVLDADGMEGLQSLKALNTPATTWLARTGRPEGGWHQFFQHPGAEISVRSCARFQPGLDVRGDGGYIVLPPSKHASGQPYRWLTAPDEMDLAPLPHRLANLLAGTSSNGHTRPNDSRILEGQRNEHLFRLGRALHAAGKSRAAISAALHAENATRCAPPLAETEVRDIVTNAAALPDVQTFAHSRLHREGPLGIGLGEFLAKSFPPQVPLIEGLLSDDGGGWIGGEEKLGKTFYALDEALCLALSMPVCDRFQVPERRRVLFVEEEDSPRRTHRRLVALLRGHDLDPDDQALRAELDEYFRIAVWQGFNLDDQGAIKRLEDTIAEFLPAVVYIDVLRKVTLKDLNKAVEATSLLDALDRLRRDYGVIFRIVHHYRKSQGQRSGRGSQEMSGSFVLPAWGENSLFFEPMGRQEGIVRVSIQSKDSPAQPDFMLAIESEGPDHDPHWVRLMANETKMDTMTSQRVLDALGTLPREQALTGEPGVSLDAIVKETKRSDKAVRMALKALESQKRIRVVGKATKQKKLYGVISQ
jgi:Bifunctional DNA primase/polymerase, N-terminal/AAA domain/Primase C terminal 1 (PriCT-1)